MVFKQCFNDDSITADLSGVTVFCIDCWGGINKTNSLGIAVQNYNLLFLLSKLLARILVPTYLEPFI